MFANISIVEQVYTPLLLATNVASLLLPSRITCRVLLTWSYKASLVHTHTTSLMWLWYGQGYPSCTFCDYGFSTVASVFPLLALSGTVAESAMVVLACVCSNNSLVVLDVTSDGTVDLGSVFDDPILILLCWHIANLRSSKISTWKWSDCQGIGTRACTNTYTLSCAVVAVDSCTKAHCL